MIKDYLFLPCKTVYFRKTIKFAQYIGRRSVNCNKIRESMISCVGFWGIFHDLVHRMWTSPSPFCSMIPMRHFPSLPRNRQLDFSFLHY